MLAEIFFGFIYFDAIIRQWLKKSSSFFSRANEVKAYGLVQELILRMLRDFISQ